MNTITVDCWELNKVYYLIMLNVFYDNISLINIMDECIEITFASTKYDDNSGLLVFSGQKYTYPNNEEIWDKIRNV